MNSPDSRRNFPFLHQILLIQNKMVVDEADEANNANIKAAAAAQQPAVKVMMIDRLSVLLQKIDLSVSDRFLLATVDVFSLADAKGVQRTVRC